jgi:hypothetical protein
MVPADPGTSRVARVDFNRGLLLRPDEVIDRADTSGLRPYRSTRVTAIGIAQMKATPLVEAVQAQGFVRPWTDLDKVCFESLLW